MRTSRGFSLVELLVVLAITGVLMAGLATIFSSSLSSFYTTGELLGTHRRNRWILNQLGDDLRMAGHTDGLLSSKVTPDIPLSEMPFVIRPGGTPASPMDTIDFFMNEPVRELLLDAATPFQATTLPLRAQGGGSLGVKAGDFLIIKDGSQAEYGYSKTSTESGAITLMNSDEQQAIPTVFAFMRYGTNALQYPHKLGSRVTVLRPCQLVHYGIEQRALDPAQPGVEIPCLVRKQADFGGGTQANWDPVAGDVVAENVSSIRFDMSVDGGVTWDRGTTWDATVASANSKLAAANQINTRQFWFKSVPLLIRVEVRSRTSMARAEYSNTPGTAAFKERTQILVIAPRNFANPI